MKHHYQCYFLDSGLVHQQDVFDDEEIIEVYNPEDPEEPLFLPVVWIPYENRPWFVPSIHGTCSVVFDFGDEWERCPWFFVPQLETFSNNKDDDTGKAVHPLYKALKTQFTRDNWEVIEDKIEAAGGLRRAIEVMDIGRLGRRIKRLYQGGALTLQEIQKIRRVFRHLTTEME